jgi:hypothetical protein
MSRIEDFKMEHDQELGLALREALATHHDGAFLTRVRARMNQRAPSWDEQLAGWFWRGLAAATAAMVMAGFGLSQATAMAPEGNDQPTVASQLLLGDQPGVEVLLVSMQEPR